ncbi:unnamed protein product [Rotaria socialis]|uniref:SET domain-containing protein n=2 Tax=Rotaria socialis TaxID=392032 RepID=A0A819YKG5_9BILA|nr:unnamed protein product [Rotaria socialis]
MTSSFGVSQMPGFVASQKDYRKVSSTSIFEHQEYLTMFFGYCDQCLKVLVHGRDEPFVCNQCPYEFFVCNKCIAHMPRQHPSMHTFSKSEWHNVAFKLAHDLKHFGILCDGCGTKSFGGTRHRCQRCDTSFDLCEKCIGTTPKNHTFKIISNRYLRACNHKLLAQRVLEVIYPSLVDSNSYALATTPTDTVYIAKSSLPNAGLGVFASRRIARFSYFGPYVGYKRSVDLIHGASSYAWNVLDKSGNVMYYIDAVDPKNSNWLRFVNCPNNFAQRNLMSLVYHGDIFYLSIRNIEVGEELLVYYGDAYAEKLGIDTKQFQ